MKKIFKKVVSVATAITMLTSLLFVTDTTQTNAYEGDAISLKPWSFYEGCITIYDGYSDGSFYNSVTTSTGETNSDWDYEYSKNGDYKTWDTTNIANGFTAKIKTTGWGALYENGTTIDTPYTLRADMKNIEVIKGHDYTLSFEARWGTSGQKHMSISINDNNTNESLIKNSNNDSALFTLSNYTQTYSQTFTVTSENNIDISFAYGPYVTSNEVGQDGTLEITNVRIFDNGVNPDYEEPPIPPTDRPNKPSYVAPPSYCYEDYKEVFCNAGEDYTFDISDLESNWNNYTVKWTKWLPGENGYINELEESGTTYTIHNAGEDDFSKQIFYTSESGPYYNAKVLDSDGEVVKEKWFRLFNKAEYIKVKSKEYNRYVNAGDSVTFGIEAYDADDNPIDLAQKGYTISWYKGVDSNDGEDNKKIEGANGLNYTVDKVSSEELWDWREENDFGPYYLVEITKDNQVITREKYIMVDKNTVIDLVNDGIIVANLGDKITLTPELRDADDNKIDLNDGRYTFKWSKVTMDGTYELETSGISYTIDKVSESDFCYKVDDENPNFGCYYRVIVYRDGEYVAWGIYTLTKNTGVKPTENPTVETSKNPQLNEQETSTKPQTTEQPSNPTPTNKIIAPAQAKIAKINTKKKSDKKVKLSLKKIKKAKGYQVAVYTSGKVAKNDKNAKKALVKKYVKNIKVTLISNKLKNKKKLYVRVRAYVLDGKTKIYGKWSAVKPIKIKK